MSSDLSHKEKVIKNLILGGCHLGSKKITKQMQKYVYKIKKDGICIFDVEKTYEKIQVAARIIATVDPESVVCVSGREGGQIAVYKFATHTKTKSITGRWSPGMLTNQITKKFIEPRLLIVTDPRVDYNALLESSYVNVPIIAICNSDNNLKYVDCAIPCNNRSPKSIAMIWYILTEEVLRLKKEDHDFANVVPEAFCNMDIIKKRPEREEPKEDEGEQIKEQPQEDEKQEDGDDDDQKDDGEDEGEENFIDQ